MKYFKKIEGEKIYLSPMNADDYEIYTKWLNDIEVVGNLGTYDKVVSLGNEKQYIEKISNERYNFSIIEKSEDRVIGNCSLMNLNEKNQVAELCIFIGEAIDRGKGYGTEATKLILDYAFYYLNLENIMLRVFSFNTQAIKSYEKAGFKKFGERTKVYYFNGEKHNEIYMEVLKEDYRR